MRIEEMEFKNWGRHEHVHATTEAAVVGLLGTNGCGKSTILEGIKYAFTGVLTDKAETYVRHFGMEGGAANGSVRIKFVKDGKRGEIFRQVGKSPKRELIWNGEAPIKAAKQIDALLEEIFSANKDAVGSVVFIKQGELDKLLFGTSSERADLFLKMLLLDFMPKRAELLRQKIETLATGITDYSALQDDLRTRREDAESEIVRLRSQLQAMPDKAVQLQEVEKWIAQADELNRLADHKTQISAFIADRQSSYSSQLSRLKEIMHEDRVSTLLDSMGNHRPTDPIEIYEYIREVKAANAMELSKLEVAASYKERRDASDKRIAELEFNLTLEELKATQREAAFNKLPSVQEIQAGLNAVKDHLVLQQDLYANVNERERLTDEIAENAAKHRFSEEEFAVEQAKLDAAKEEASMYKMRVDIFQEISCGQGKFTCCPVCDSAAALGSEDIEFKLTRDSAILKATKELVVLLTDKISAMVKANASLKQAELLLNRMLEESQAAKERLEACIAALPKNTESVDSLNAKMDESSAAFIALSDINATVRATKYELGKARDDQSFLSTGVIAQIFEYDNLLITDPDPISRKKMLINKVDAVLDSSRALYDIINNLKQTIAPKQAELLVVNEQFNKVASESYRAQQALGLGDNPGEQSMNLRTELREYQENRSSLSGQVLNAERNAQTIRTQQADVERRIDNDQKRRMLVENLRQLRETLSRGGLPMTVMNHQFKQLTELVQEHLADLGANFAVTADPDRPISFCFTRTDDELDYVMPQEKLSGGQRVRLTVAMLMAVQQLIIPEVGFLVLDEPSVHLDEEGVESLRELFQTLSAKMGSTGSQVIVCDHDQSLKSAFAAMIEIKK